MTEQARQALREINTQTKNCDALKSCFRLIKTIAEEGANPEIASVASLGYRITSDVSNSLDSSVEVLFKRFLTAK